ncbi:HD domain-containing protein [Candidatus Tisiphia endosymbiont of Nedyus quadrimaculatus]|uniref:HD domain-containing protein n=1 Tax=Candidatus Tisiphia endosymbiont of Nedyus quadrimaculatus TaxID=3139332 RepID=UPI00345E7DFE
MEDINYWDNSQYQYCAYAERLVNELILLNTKVQQPINIDVVKKGIYYAKKYHGSQMRQSGEPYYSHPIEVAYMVAQYTALEIPRLFRTDMLVTALLHDTIEDTKLTEKMIAYIFGDQVASQVEDLTRVKPSGKISSAETLDLLFPQKKYDVALIKLFDRIHNLETLGAKSPEKAKKIVEEPVIHFLTLAMHLRIPTVTKQIITLCCQHLSIPLREAFVDNFQSFSPTFQNEISQMQNLCKLETISSLSPNDDNTQLSTQLQKR